MYSCIGVGAFYLYNLNEAPFTHRLRFLWVPYWLEKKIGDYSYRQILAQYGNRIVAPSSPYYRQISDIMNRLLSTALANTPDQSQVQHLKSLNWSIHIIQATAQEPPNAFILPNGKIFIFSSILPVCQNQDGLATVLAHELSHQLAHHSSEQLSKQPIYILLSTALYVATGISWFNDLLIAGLLQMPSSREMESEADHIGCELMARLCFNIQEAVRFWTRMDQFERTLSQAGLMKDFLSTHPNTTKRIADIKLWMPDLENIAESSNCNSWSKFHEASRNFFGH